MMRISLCISLLATVILITASPAKADLIGGVEFPQGSASFADAVISFTAGMVGTYPSTPHLGDFNALGLPDYAGINSCTSQGDCTFVSLGDGGNIVLSFTDNKLTGSGDSTYDLWIFEVGPDVEDTYVEISKDGTNWNSVGKVYGSTAGIDIDAYGYGIGDLFGYVRLTDDTLEGGQTGITVGADIDAVGAISTVLTPTIPEPTSLLLLGTGLGALGLVAYRLRKK